MIHGTADDNVHFQSAAEMEKALVDHDVDFDDFVSILSLKTLKDGEKEPLRNCATFCKQIQCTSLSGTLGSARSTKAGGLDSWLGHIEDLKNGACGLSSFMIGRCCHWPAINAWFAVTVAAWRWAP